MSARRAVTWSRDHVFERSAVQDRRAILETALARGMRETTYAAIQNEFERRVRTGEFREVAQRGTDRQFTAVVQNLDRQGRIHEIPDPGERTTAIAKEYANSPERTWVVSPDNRSRMEINERIHAEMQSRRTVNSAEHRIRTLVPRQNLTCADRTGAARYEAGDVLRYSRASKETGIGKGEYAEVKSIDAPTNRLTVELQDGTERIYDPCREQGVSVFLEEMRSFSVGDCIQFTAPVNDLKLANRELGIIESISSDGRLRLQMDSGRAVALGLNRDVHLDFGYAVTSHSSQGQTADRVLIQVDTKLGAKDLLNSRMAYVAVSRGAHDAQIFTNDETALGLTLSRDVSHAPAIQQNPASQAIGQKQNYTHEIGPGFGMGM